jgi:hypothetical protein
MEHVMTTLEDVVVMEAIDNDEKVWREKILHVLSIYPRISLPMLQVAISTGAPPKLWKPVFDKMVVEGVVKIENVNSSNPSGRALTYRVISLTAQDL